MSNGQKAGRKRVKVREYLSNFPFFLDHTWDTPTTLRLTIDLATFSLILREFETGKRNFASGGSRPSDRGRGGGRAVVQTLRYEGGPGPSPGFATGCLRIQSSLLSPRHRGRETSLVVGSEEGRLYSQAQRILARIV